VITGILFIFRIILAQVCRLVFVAIQFDELVVRPCIPPGKEGIRFVPVWSSAPTDHRRDDLCLILLDWNHLDDLLQVLILLSGLLGKLFVEDDFQDKEFAFYVAENRQADRSGVADRLAES
jgi:hypothetical protein